MRSKTRTTLEIRRDKQLRFHWKLRDRRGDPFAQSAKRWINRRDMFRHIEEALTGFAVFKCGKRAITLIPYKAGFNVIDHTRELP